MEEWHAFQRSYEERLKVKKAQLKEKVKEAVGWWTHSTPMGREIEKGLCGLHSKGKGNGCGGGGFRPKKS